MKNVPPPSPPGPARACGTVERPPPGHWSGTACSTAPPSLIAKGRCLFRFYRRERAATQDSNPQAARRSASLRALASLGISGRAAVHLAAATRFWSTATRRGARLRAATAALLSSRHEAIAAWGLHAWAAAARALKLRAHAGAALKRLANARWVRAWEQWRAVAAGDRAAATLRRAADALRGLRRMEAAWARWTGLVQRNSALARCADDAARAARALRAWRGLARAWAVWHERMRRTLRAR